MIPHGHPHAPPNGHHAPHPPLHHGPPPGHHPMIMHDQMMMNVPPKSQRRRKPKPPASLSKLHRPLTRFYCNDCKKKFRSRILANRNNNAVQHYCALYGKIITRKVEAHSNKCKGDHGMGPCVVKRTDNDPDSDGEDETKAAYYADKGKKPRTRAKKSERAYSKKRKRTDNDIGHSAKRQRMDESYNNHYNNNNQYEPPLPPSSSQMPPTAHYFPPPPNGGGYYANSGGYVRSMDGYNNYPYSYDPNIPPIPAPDYMNGGNFHNSSIHDINEDDGAMPPPPQMEDNIDDGTMPPQPEFMNDIASSTLLNTTESGDSTRSQTPPTIIPLALHSNGEDMNGKSKKISPRINGMMPPPPALEPIQDEINIDCDKNNNKNDDGETEKNNNVNLKNNDNVNNQNVMDDVHNNNKENNGIIHLGDETLTLITVEDNGAPPMISLDEMDVLNPLEVMPIQEEINSDECINDDETDDDEFVLTVPDEDINNLKRIENEKLISGGNKDELNEDEEDEDDDIVLTVPNFD